LRKLYLNDNDFTGSIPDGFEDLINLIALHLHNNKLGGTADAAPSKLLGLEELRLDGNSKMMIESDFFLLLPSLKVLGLSGGGTTTLPPQIQRLTNLETLTLDWFDGTLPETIGKLTALRTLSLQINYFAGSFPWSSFGDHLEHLHIGDNYFAGSLPEDIDRFSSLLSLDVSDNKMVGSIPARIGNMTNLKSLELNDNALTGVIPSTMGQMTSLRVLHLSKNQLNGEIPAELDGLTNLGECIADAPSFTDFNPFSYMLSFYWTESIALENNQLSGDTEFLCNSTLLVEVATDCNGDFAMNCSCCGC
jgi:Leucine-rich repeat (LRR) protein